MGVTRCICRDVPFEVLKRLADSGVGSLDGLQRQTGCGTGCGMCLPYVLRLLESGQTDQPVMSAAEFDAWNARRLAASGEAAGRA
jgi:bacterioferritin-associated ferredoxin